MAGFGVAFLLFVLFALALPIGLYYLVRAEHDERETMTRDEAERAARRDTRDEESRGR